MICKEVKCDLFSLPKDYMLAHCISADYALGAGIAKVFRDKCAFFFGGWYEKFCRVMGDWKNLNPIN